MAARFACKEYSFSDTTPIKLTTILGFTNTNYLSTLVMRANKDNDTKMIYWGGPDVTSTTNRGGFLQADDAVGIDVVNKFFGTDEVWLVGESGAVLHITWIQ